jgi:hypothetical protein
VARPPLPPSTSKAPDVVQIRPGPSNLLSNLAPEAQEKIARESTEEWRITLPKTLSNLHHILKTWVMEDRNRGGTSQSAYVHQPPRNTTIDRRRLRILNALFWALEKRGHQVVANPQSPRDVDLIVEGERLEFNLSQRQKQLKVDLTREEPRNPLNAALGIRSRTTLQPTGTVVFKIHSWIGTGMRTQWRDGARGPLEEKMNDIVGGLLAAAATISREKLEREEEHRRQLVERLEKEEEVRRKEAQRLKELLQRVERWRRAVDIRAYVKAVRTAHKPGHELADQKNLEEWASWALALAARIDPLTSGDALSVNPPRNPEQTEEGSPFFSAIYPRIEQNSGPLTVPRRFQQIYGRVLSEMIRLRGGDRSVSAPNDPTFLRYRWFPKARQYGLPHSVITCGGFAWKQAFYHRNSSQ